MDTQYIYLLQEREFINSKQSIYKIGKTKQHNNKRFCQYPKGSILLFQMICSNCDDYEKKILILFDNNFKKRPDIGREYFEGNYKMMINIIKYIIDSGDKDIVYNVENVENVENIYKYKTEKYKCNCCEKKYTSYKSLWTHNKFHHDGVKIIINDNKEINITGTICDKNNEYMCRTCNKKYKHHQTRWTHEKKCFISIK